MRFAREDVARAGDHDAGSAETDWRSFDTVFLAALVGLDSPAKIRVLRNLARRLRPGALVVCRSARGLRSVLYPVRARSGEEPSFFSF